MKMNDILEFNKKFVENKLYLPYETTKDPKYKTLILTCMDTRLTLLLPAALGINNGDVHILKNAGGYIDNPTGDIMKSILVSIYAFDIRTILVIAHDDCGMLSASNSYLIENMKNRGVKPSVFSMLETLNIDLVTYLEGFTCVDNAVSKSIHLLKQHPLIAKDIIIAGMVMDPTTGALRVVEE